MKLWLRFLPVALAGLLATITVRAQQTPVLTVSITQIQLYGAGINNPPTATYNSPNEASGAAGVTVTLSALAVGTFPEGGHTYTFTVNGQNLGSPANPLNGSPGIVGWTPPLPGIYYISVKADDGLGNVVNSLAVRYYATGTAVTSPVEGTLVPVGSSVVLKADATVASGFVQQIQFFDNGTPIGTDTTYPYSLIYAVPGVSGSAHAITAQATDNNGNLLTLSSAVNLQLITPIGGVPTVSITSPTNGAAIAVPTGSNTIPIAVTANAANSDGRITKVEVYLDGELFATDTTFPYSTTWAPTAVGTYRLTALAYDDKNNVPASSTNVISISAPPTVSITSPSSGNYVASGTVTTVTANAADADGSITQVEFYANGAFIGVDTAAPYSVSWTPTFQTDDSGNPIPSSLTAIAKDNVGLSTISTAVSVNVTDGGGGGGAPIGLLPTTSLTTPTNGSTVAVNKATAVNAIASDPDGTITGVQFYANGVSLGSTTVFPYTATWTPTAPGTYLLKSVATDNDGNQSSSAEITVTVSGGEPPVVAITSPVAGATVNLGGATTVSATATDADGSVASVQFFANGVSIGTDSASPYTASWTPTTPGIYTLTAVGTDNSGLQSSSTTVTVIVAGTAPAVSITGPTGTATVNTPQTITATASDSDGIVSGVQFYVNGVSIGTDLTYPYTMAWTPDALGSYTLTAVATDNSGLQMTSAGSTVTVASGSAPSVSITYPGSGGAVPVNATTNITASATDSDGTIANVQFFVNGVLLVSDTAYPYTASWAPTAPGQYALQAVATDNAGNQTTHAITANVTSTAPTVSITAPAAGAIALGSTVTVTASASDSDGTVGSVQFFSNGVSLGTVLTSPYSVSWTPVSAGSVSLTAVVTDNSGLAVTSSTVSVTVGSRPTASITSPANGASLATGANTITATAADSDGTIASVDFRVDGVSVGTDTSSPYSTSWTATAGTHTLTVIATDNSGLQTTSSAVNVTVTGTVPTVSITSPAAAANIPLGSSATITASASDTGGTIASVQFFANGVSVGVDTTEPFSANWIPAVSGTYSLVAVATDNDGLSASSAAVSVIVAAGSPPSISIVNPLSGSSVTVGTPQIVAVDVTPGSYSISGVQFYVNGSLVAASSSYPYGTVWTPTNLGAYSLTAVVTDAFGNRVTSAPVSVTVPAATTVVSVVSNSGITAVPQGSTVILRAEPSASQGVIKQVQFFDNGVAVGSPATDAPYTLVYRPSASVGSTRVITAQATNANGVALAMSAGVSLTVTSAVAPLPTVAIGNPLDGAKIAIIAVPDSDNAIPVTVNTSLTSGFVTRVELYIEGALFGSTTTYPYAFSWKPSVTGTYHLVALVYDNHNNVVVSTVSANTTTTTPAATTVVIAAPPVVSITSPADSGTLTGGSQMQVSLVASSSNGYPLDVQLFQDDRYVGGTSLGAGGVGTISYVPTRKTRLDGAGNIIVDPSALYAIATDPLGFTTKSVVLTNLTVSTGGSSSGSTVIGLAPTVTLTAPTASSSFPVSSPVTVSANAADTDGNISSVTFMVNNQIVSTLTAYPYTIVWTPLNLGTYAVAAKVTDNDGNTVTSSPVTVTVVDPSPGVPTVSITRPSVGTSLTAGTTTSLTATASDDVAVASVQFYINGQPFDTLITKSPYNATWAPATPGVYTIAARVTDNIGKQATSTPVSVTVTPNAAPSVSLTSPGASTVVAGSTVALAATASDADGTVSSVSFLANNIVVATAAASPYTATWTAGSAGTYTLVAQATDNSGNVASSSTVTLTVVANQAPTVSITAPANGGVLNVGAARTITATAADSDGTISSVQFLANGAAIATVTAAPFRTDWTPTNEGVYRLTAVATDNAGATRTSSEVTVLAAIVSAASSDTIYRGSYVGLGETGSFAAVNLHGRTATFIGYVESYASGVAKTYYYADVPIDAGGGFTVRDTANKVLITGTFGPTGVSGSLDAARLTFIGPVSFANTTTPVASGYYSGSLVGRYASILTGLVGPDGSITLYVKDGTFVDSGAGTVDSTGAFTITTRAGNTIAGKADPATGFLSGSVSGGLSATFAAAGSSGNTFSDGFLRNISTRGVAGTANNVLIAGFVVNGTVPKQILVRAIGPSIGSGLTGLLADPQLQLYTAAGAPVSGGYNNDWSGLASTFSAVGAFSLTPGSKDAAVLVTLAPGVYSAQVSGFGGTSGLALVELYDVDNQSAFSSQKMVNISTRGQVGTGSNILIAGFVVNGTSSKKVLIRGAGPALAPYIASGTLADPILRVVRVSDGATIRENDNWEVGNDPTLVRDAAAKVGAFAFTTGSKDAVILMTLPPGIYSAQLSGASSGTGIGLVEVYEVP